MLKCTKPNYIKHIDIHTHSHDPKAASGQVHNFDALPPHRQRPRGTPGLGAVQQLYALCLLLLLLGGNTCIEQAFGNAAACRPACWHPLLFLWRRHTHL